MKKMNKEGQDILNNCSKRKAFMQPYKEDKQRALQMKESGAFNDTKPAAANTEVDEQRLVSHIVNATMRTISNSAKSTKKASNRHSNRCICMHAGA